jgi:hypothetical protein
MVLPRFIAEGVGLVSIDGGRGSWLFAEADAVFFDLVLLVAAVLAGSVIRRPKFWRDATVWYDLLDTSTVGAALAYSIRNFGSLFRERAMVFIGVMLLILLAARSRSLAETSTPRTDEHWLPAKPPLRADGNA